MVCLIFHTAIIINRKQDIINRKNQRVTIKLNFGNLSIFFKKENVHTCQDPASPCSFLFPFKRRLQILILWSKWVNRSSSGTWGPLLPSNYQSTNLPVRIMFVKDNFITIFLQIFVSKKWGFTKWDREEYLERRRNGSIKPDGTNVQYFPDKGTLKAWKWRESRQLQGM